MTDHSGVYLEQWMVQWNMYILYIYTVYWLLLVNYWQIRRSSGISCLFCFLHSWCFWRFTRIPFSASDDSCMGCMGRTVRLGKLLQESPAWNRRFAFNSALGRLGPFNWPPTFAAIIPCHPFFQGTSSSEDTGLFAQGVLGSSILRLTGGISKRSINRSWINPQNKIA